jgi:hypothetical protein
MFTNVMISSTVTSPFPSQSPTHALTSSMANTPLLVPA